MNTDKLIARQYQDLIRKRFPTVLVMPDVSGVPYDDIYDVFFIPDERFNEYLECSVDALPYAAEKAGLPYVSLIDHTTSATLQYYQQYLPTDVASPEMAYAEANY